MKKVKFCKTPLATGIAIALGISTFTPSYAQDSSDQPDNEAVAADQAELAANDESEGMLEEVVVTGIRSSLIESMDRKRDANGVVDAITSEDIGKFPDTNLAEAMQRITGVSIDRSGSRGVEGEGQRITVRGIGPDFNLVLLNGRQMPGTSLQGTTFSSSRAFDFSNLASESVSGVDVYKTSMATIPTGGIGATVNIRTARPLDSGNALSLGAKGVYDTAGDTNAWTPEVSGIFSRTFADDTFGIALSAVYQEREYGYDQAGTTSGWIPENRLDPGWQALPAPGATMFNGVTVTPNSPYVNNPAGRADVLYSLPQNLTYITVDGERERLNSQLVLQFRPTDRIEMTLDYTYSELEVQERRNDLGIWFIQCGLCGGSTGSFTDGPISTPLTWSEDFTGRDVGSGGGRDGFKTELDSIGFNAEWDFSDNLLFHFDYHDSTSESGSASPFGSSSVIGGVLFTTGGRAGVDYSQDLPVMILDLPAGNFAAANMLTGGASFRNSYQKSEVEQIDLGGRWDIDDTNSLDFGVTSTEVNNRSAFSNVQYDNWGGIGSPADYPDSLWQIRDVRSLFSGIPGSERTDLVNQMFIWNFADVAAARQAATGQSMAANPNFTDDLRTTEESMSAYVQLNRNFDIGTRNANVRVGARYESTDVDSSALVPIPEFISWVGANEFAITYGDPDFTSLEGDYEYFLPSIDFDVGLSENLILRASYSHTIGRPDWKSIQGGQTLNTLVRRDFGNGNQGNPALLPLESKNYDLSLEWYYAEGSYVSVAYFYKDTSNYVGVSTVEETPFDLPHPGNGEWYNECNAATGGAFDAGKIRQCIFETYGDSPFVDITGTDAAGNFTGTIQGIAGQDPAALFLINVPSNQKDAKIDGLELAVQHLWGDSGFGTILNYTFVDSDISYDNFQTNNQFAILGLSDSANAVMFYDKHGFIARVAYNWRDEFLAGTVDGNGIGNPIYVDAYGQYDAIVSYTFSNDITLFAEGINLTDEYSRSFSRRQEQVQYVTNLGARYGVGVRWAF